MMAAHKYNLEIMEHLNEIDRQKASEAYRQSQAALPKHSYMVNPIHIKKEAVRAEEAEAAAAAAPATPIAREAAAAAAAAPVGKGAGKKNGPNALQKMMDRNVRQRAAMLGNI
jgi:hypothetical protein